MYLYKSDTPSLTLVLLGSLYRLCQHRQPDSGRPVQEKNNGILSQVEESGHVVKRL